MSMTCARTADRHGSVRDEAERQNSQRSPRACTQQSGGKQTARLVITLAFVDISSGDSSLKQNSALSPTDSETTGDPAMRLSLDSSLSCECTARATAEMSGSDKSPSAERQALPAIGPRLVHSEPPLAGRVEVAQADVRPELRQLRPLRSDQRLAGGVAGALGEVAEVRGDGRWRGAVTQLADVLVPAPKMQNTSQGSAFEPHKSSSSREVDCGAPCLPAPRAPVDLRLPVLPKAHHSQRKYGAVAVPWRDESAWPGPELLARPHDVRLRVRVHPVADQHHAVHQHLRARLARADGQKSARRRTHTAGGAGVGETWRGGTDMTVETSFGTVMEARIIAYTSKRSLLVVERGSPVRNLRAQLERAFVCLSRSPSRGPCRSARAKVERVLWKKNSKGIPVLQSRVLAAGGGGGGGGRGAGGGGGGGG